jgi:pimeloyl-ACP methyl ester carboxylesterase
LKISDPLNRNCLVKPAADFVSVDSIHAFCDVSDYLVDAAQRCVLFWDVLRQRGNVYLEHVSQGQPPVLVFDYEMILDGRGLERPVNYALVRILDRRCRPRTEKHDGAASPGASCGRGAPRYDRRHSVGAGPQPSNPRPIIIIDPRAGHGPGIGGSKQDSQIGMALDAGHTVYFMVFSTEPVPDQTLADVCRAQVRFVEEVRRRHPDAPKPAVIGNCQGGWAAALIGAERPDLVGPMVYNGSPLSYWGGVQGIHFMRYRGGLLGGVWVNSFLSDLGHGKFDGAHLVANFEDLNPANTLWAKYYHLYAHIDTEERRFLEFEKWWGGFFLMTDKEIHTILESLFVGNQLERGEFELEQGRRVDLKSNTNPVVVFASFGDNITPPQQAFNWIANVYGSAEEIRRRGQAIVVHLHESIGHLGIFVSAKIARKEHKEIIASFDMLDYLPPGLYGMIITEDPEKPGKHQVRFVEKTTQELLAIDDGPDDEMPFHAAQTVSRVNDHLYQTLSAPWIKAAASDGWAELLRQLHPLRMQRYLLSDLNPWMIPVKTWAAAIKNNRWRRPATDGHPLRRAEARFSEAVVDTLNRWGELRDRMSELLFKAIYESPWMKWFYPLDSADGRETEIEREALRRQDADQWREATDQGGFGEAVTRMILALMLADRDVARKGYRLAGRLFETHSRLKQIDPQRLKSIILCQARILQTDTDLAIETLPALLPTQEDRRQAMELLNAAIQDGGRPLNVQEQAVLGRIGAVLGIKPPAFFQAAATAPLSRT